MASPYAAGLCAALISHAHTGGQAASATRREDQDHLAPGLAAGVQIRPTWRVRACDVRRALCLSARPVPGASVLDMGYGVPDLPKAAELLDTILAAAADDPVIGYKISTPCPHGHKGRARAAYWRSTYFPQQERQTFTISPVFAPTVDASARTSFVRKFTLRSKASWCRVPQETIYLRSEQDARAFVEYDAGQLVEPGLYIGTVEALGDGLAAFRLINTIIIPYRFAAQDDFKRSFKGRTVQGWKPDRYFCAIPPGASMLKLVLSAPEGQTSKAGFDDIFDPNGRPFRNGKRLNTETGQREVEWTMAEDLTPGVWEVPVLSDRPDKSWPYDLTVQFLGLHADPARITEGSASKPSGELTVTNLFEKPVAGTTDGQIEGFRLHKQDKFKGLKDELSYSVSLDDRFNRLRLRLEMTPEDYATTTDIAVLVKDSSGEAVHKGAFDDRIYEATFSTEGNKSLEVVIHGGFAVADDKRETPITVQIDTLFASPVTVKVERDGESSIDFVPGVPVKLEFSTAEKLKDIPDAQRPVGFLRVRERASNDTVLRVPLDIGS
jgi:hypothetical protein